MKNKIQKYLDENNDLKRCTDYLISSEEIFYKNVLKRIIDKITKVII